MTQPTYTPDGPLLPYPGWTPPPKRPKIAVLLVAIACMLVGAVGITLAITSRPHAAAATATLPTTYTVIYEADSVGTAAGSITLEAPTGTQQANVDLPLKSEAGDTGLTFSTQPGAFVYLSVQNENDSGSVTCRITVKAVTGSYEVSRVISENTSTGGHVIASCKGSVS